VGLGLGLGLGLGDGIGRNGAEPCDLRIKK